MTERRHFRPSERLAMNLAQNGRCASCGEVLAPGWHADHIEPWSRGGTTDVLNGQALCAACNRRKGSGVIDPGRFKWQDDARQLLRARLAQLEPDQAFLVGATPGAGKTRFALSTAAELVATGRIERVSVVVPTDALRTQWADQGDALGIPLVPLEARRMETSSYRGSVVTYQAIAGGGVIADMERAACRRRTLVIFDELHHAGEGRAFGDRLRYAYGPATYKLALTGTPWRRDTGSPIPFVRYGEDGEVHVDFRYTYGDAVRDQVCRRIDFHAYDGKARWLDAGQVVEKAIREGEDDESGVILTTILDPAQQWIREVLKEAVNELDRMRVDVPNAGGLVVAADQWHAQAYARLLTEISGEEATLVISDEDNAKNRIAEFRRSEGRWIVAVNMVSEGVDIPRLAVGVYASRYQTELFFQQVVGRFVRRAPEDDHNAVLYIPALRRLGEFARSIEEMLAHRLREAQSEYQRAESTAREGQQLFDLVTPISATDSALLETIQQGEALPADLMLQAREAAGQMGVPLRFAPGIARWLRERGTGVREAAVTIQPRPHPVPTYKLEKELRGRLTTLIGKIQYRDGRPFVEVQTEVVNRFGRRNQMDISTLEAAVAFCENWLAKLSEVSR